MDSSTESKESGPEGFIAPSVDAEGNKYDQVFQSMAERCGLARGARLTIEHFGSEITRKASSATQEVLDKSPVLLLLTHDYPDEIIAAVAGMPSTDDREFRQDVRLLAQEPETYGSWINEFVFPLYNVKIEPPKGFLRRARRIIDPPQKIPENESLALNTRSIRSAFRWIAGSGGIVAYCPEGTRPKYADWRGDGVGRFARIMKRGSGGPEKPYIVFCDVLGVKMMSFFNTRTGLIKGGTPFLSDISVRYSEPIDLGQLDTDRSSVNISLDLQKQYMQWISLQDKLVF